MRTLLYADDPQEMLNLANGVDAATDVSIVTAMARADSVLANLFGPCVEIPDTGFDARSRPGPGVVEASVTWVRAILGL